MKAFLFFCVIAILLISCLEEEKLPPDIFPIKTMKVLVWELSVAEQKASQKYVIQKDSLRMETTALFQQVFQKYKTDKKNFYRSFAYYEARPDLLKVLFDSVSQYGARQKMVLYKKNF